MLSRQASILVVDDERSVTDLLGKDLGEEGYGCVAVGTGEDALKKLTEDNFDVMLLDLRLPGISGINVLKEAKSIRPEVQVIVVTGAGDAQTAVEAMKIGAEDYITKPFELEKVNNSVKLALIARTVRKSKSNAHEKGSGASTEDTSWTRCLDAIAEGVETRLSSLTGHVITMTIIERTIAVAQSLSIPEDHIEKWADTQRKRIERVNILASLLDKLEQSPAAQSAQGMICRGNTG